MLERRDERGRRESRELLPYAAVNRRRELDDPRADRERQRGNRRGRRVLGHRSKRDGERNRQAGIEYLTDRDDDELWPHDAATVARPKRDRHERSPRARHQPTSSTTTFVLTRSSGGSGRCSSSLRAPLWRSPDTRRMATNGSRKTAAISKAPKVGPHTPMSGSQTAPQPPRRRR